MLEAKNAADNFIFGSINGGNCTLPLIIARAEAIVRFDEKSSTTTVSSFPTAMSFITVHTLKCDLFVLYIKTIKLKKQPSKSLAGKH